jgi:16S rRNA (uracil1498-N3)-methyltransferase
VHRFTLAPERIDGDRVTFDRTETRHLARVLRLGPGDVVLAADGAGRELTVRVESLGEEATGTVLAVATRALESPLAVTLLQGVPRGDKMEAIVRACTELGVARVCPVIAERTIVRLEPARWRERARRWQRVAREAAKQCGRAVIPDVDPPRPLVDWLEHGEGAGLGLCLWEGATTPLALALDGLAEPPRVLRVLVGPEGGLARSEVEAARARGFALVGLGPRILRTETAAPAFLTIVQSRFGDLTSHSPGTEQFRWGV